MSDEFVNTQIDTDNENLEKFQDDVLSEEEDVENKKLENKIRGKDIIHLKSNFIRRGLIPLEKLFDRNDVANDPKVHPGENVV